MNKILALDLGDKWIGTAISDGTQTLARPLETIEISKLDVELLKILQNEPVSVIVIGYPKTMSGSESEQTKKIIKEKDELSEKFTSVKFVMWDERLSSKRAQVTFCPKDKSGKIKSHSIAAAHILQLYLDYLKNGII